MKSFLKNIFSVQTDEDFKNRVFKVIKILGLEFRFRQYKKIRGKNNKIFIKKNGKLNELKGYIPGLFILIRGNDNTIIIEEPFKFVNSVIICEGNSNSIHIEATKHIYEKLSIDAGHNWNNRKIHIKKNTAVVEAKLLCWSSNSSIIIGEDCLISWNVVILNNDGHTITRPGSREVINKGSYCEIGNHVWIAQHAFIGKNVKIGDNNIVGAYAVVTKSFNENNSAIAGNPAKIVKQNIEWHR